jgi:D-tagatose-1,6-bisphosphate aldolase subunit GatZ/KbaZ
MYSFNFLDNLVDLQKNDNAVGITSICSANPEVLETILRYALKTDNLVLIESTCNQVNQYGGYTGMDPISFVTHLRTLAEKIGFPEDHLLIGGDHLGPNVWKNEATDLAMEKSRLLVRDYINAGYQKIHIDTSMKCGNDPQDRPLEPKVIAERTADLVAVSESTFSKMGIKKNYLRYVIGTEVPTPGGIQGENETANPTKQEDIQETIELTKRAFYNWGLDEAWERVIAVVVQPGVEFGDHTIIDYDPAAAVDLKHFIEKQKHLIYEVHSTDFQTQNSLKQLVEDHFAILKVGPALTFAYREAIFALALIEQELSSIRKDWKTSNIINIIENAMLDYPEYWQSYYLGSEEENAFSRRFSFSDRIRYYFPVEDVQEALGLMIENLSNIEIPLSLLSQYLPNQYRNIRSGSLPNKPTAILQHSIIQVYKDYLFACGNDLINI